MSSRTYVPQLLNILRRLCLYLIRYRDKLVAAGETGTASAIDVVIEGCNALVALLPVDIPEE